MQETKSIDGKNVALEKHTSNKKISISMEAINKFAQNKILSKTICVLLASILALGLFPFTQTSRACAQESNVYGDKLGVQAQNNNTNDVTDEEANYALVVENGTMVVDVCDVVPSYRLVFTYCDSEPETYEGQKVVAAYTDFLNCAYYSVPWSSYRSSINQVTFANITCPQSTNAWFYGFQYLTTINGIENLNTSCVTNMSSMFESCSSLVDINLLSFNTSNVTNMQYMFYGCLSLNSLDLSSFDTSNVANIASMFACCSSLTTLDLSCFDTNSVTDMQSMFAGCLSLNSLDLSSFDTSNVVNMASMFACCSSLTTLDLSCFDTSNVSDMSAMFSYCEGLTNLDLSSFNIAKVNYMNSMFSYNSALTTINVRCGYWDSISIANSKDMFKNCFNLRGSKGTVYDPNYTSGTYARIDGGNNNPGYLSAIYSNYALLVENGTIESTENGSTQVYRLVFAHCESEPSSYEGCKVVAAYQDFQNTQFVPWTRFAEYITQVDFDSVTFPLITDYWFSSFKRLTQVNGLKNLDTRNTTSMQGMFTNCMELANLNLFGLDTSNVINMGGMFYGCSSLTSIDLSSFNTSKVTNMSGMFYGCESATSLDLSGFDTSNVTTMSYMFGICKSLTSLDLSRFDTSRVLDTSGMFCYDSNLITINVSRDLWNTSNCVNTIVMFENCIKIMGYRGTCYDPNKTDCTYARIDGGSERPGYLTGA